MPCDTHVCLWQPVITTFGNTWLTFPGYNQVRFFDAAMPTAQDQHSGLLDAAERYAEDLGWWLIPVRGKKPIWDGWPDYRPPLETLRKQLRADASLGIGLNLGGSGLIDLEADTPEGEMILDDLCEGVDFPFWKSQKSRHRLFQDHPDVGYLQVEALKIEFRAGRHQSVLPPSPHPSGVCGYQWVISAFQVPVPPLPNHIVDYYQERVKAPGNQAEQKARGPKEPAFPYRDDMDYVLRHYDLLAEAEKAGVRFVVRDPDNNGNLPCHVPAQLRGGRPDRHPSGVFNVRNGVLRDFATGKNHLFFNTLAALTGEPWLDIFKRYEKKAGAQNGHPHSRRIAFPTPTALTDGVTSLDEARGALTSYFDGQLRRSPRPKTLHLVKGRPGIGKTYGICKALADTGSRAVILTLENELANTHLKTLEQFGGHARRMPVLRDLGCRHPDDYEATSRRGFQPSQGLPCRRCEIGSKNCPYLLGFSSLSAADRLCCAAIYHTHNGFYEAYGNETRPVVIFDENCVDLLITPFSNPVDQWMAWGGLLTERVGRSKGALRQHITVLLRLVSWLESMTAEFTDMSDTDGRPLKFKPFPVPADLFVPGTTTSAVLAKWLNQQAFRPNNRRLVNLYDAAIQLLRRGLHLIQAARR